jgi:NADPH2:quinone reductase
MKSDVVESQASMRAVVVEEFGGPHAMKVKQVPVPHIGPDVCQGHVLVRLFAAGVNPVDTYIRAGTYGRLPTLPYTPGMDGAGVVVRSTAESVRVGERVYVGRSVTGTYAELVLCEAWQVHHLPERLTFAQGAAVHVPYWTAMQALVTKARAQPGETVLIHGGSGAVGLAAVQIAKSLGLRVIATAGSDAGAELVSRSGADVVLSHREAGTADEIRRISGYPAKGVDIVIEMLANHNLGHDLEMLAMGGRVVVVGNRGRVEINPRDLMSREAIVCGMSLMNTSAAEQAMLAERVGAGLRNGTLTPVVRVEMPLAEAARAHELVMEPGAQGKIVLVP